MWISCIFPLRQRLASPERLLLEISLMEIREWGSSCLRRHEAECLAATLREGVNDAPSALAQKRLALFCFFSFFFKKGRTGVLYAISVVSAFQLNIDEVDVLICSLQELKGIEEKTYY